MRFYLFNGGRKMGMCEKILKKNKDTVYREIAGETILVNMDSFNEGKEGKIFLLNETGTEIWELIDGKRTMEDIVNELCGEYEVSIEDAGEGVEKIAHLLLMKGLIDSA